MNKEKKFLRILKINQEYLRALSFNYWRTCRMNIIFFEIFFYKHLYASVMKLIKVLKINITLFNEGHFYIYIYIFYLETLS